MDKELRKKVYRKQVSDVMIRAWSFYFLTYKPFGECLKMAWKVVKLRHIGIAQL